MKTDSLEITVQSMLTGTDQWDLVTAFLKLRRAVFIEKMEWPLYQAEDMEFEQYDRVDTVYVIAHIGNRVVGGARLLRTDHIGGAGKVRYSYMIRDAYLGLLDGLPAAICDTDPPFSANVWELTRLISDDTAGVTELVLEATNDFLVEQKATRCLFLGPPAFMRMARSMAFRPNAMGKIQSNPDGRFLAFECPVRC